MSVGGGTLNFAEIWLPPLAAVKQFDMREHAHTYEKTGRDCIFISSSFARCLQFKMT